MKINPFAGKSSRTKIFTIITIAVLVLVLLMNLLVTSLVVYGTAYIDMTPEGLYTLRPIMEEACRKILINEDGTEREPGITVTFCDKPDRLIANYYTRIIYYMTVALSKKFKNFKVETVDVQMDPTSVAQYKNTSLTKIDSTDVIISYGSRYRIASAESFWRIGEEKVYSFDGEYKLASVMLSLTLVNRPVAYFVTNHKETYYDPDNAEHPGNAETYEFAALLSEKGLEVKNISFNELIKDANEKGITPEVPDDCVLLIINDPREDFDTLSDRYDSFSYVSETEILDRYLTDNRGSIMVAKDYKVSLPVFEDFLMEWGIECKDTLVKDSESYLKTEAEDGTVLIAEYNTDKTSYGYGIYEEYVELSSAPSVIIGDTGYVACSYGDATGMNEAGTSNTSRIYDSFLYSSASSAEYAKNSQTGTYIDVGETGRKALAAITCRKTVDDTTGDNSYSYLFCAASADFFSADYLGKASYANYDVMASLIHNIARLETAASAELGGLSLNNDDEGFLGKMLREDTISDQNTYVKEWDDSISNYKTVKTIYGLGNGEKIVYAIICALIPTAIAIVGIIICVRRKYL